MDLVFTNGRMGMNTEEISLMIISMVMGKCTGVILCITKGFGIKENKLMMKIAYDELFI